MVLRMNIVLTSSTFIGGISTLLNGFFFIFIIISPPHHLGNYKSNYYTGALTSFCFALTQSICAFSFISDETLLLLISIRGTGHVFLLIFIAAHNSLFIVIAYNFVHRYALISKKLICKKYQSTMFCTDFYYALSHDIPLFGFNAAADVSCMLFLAFGGWNISFMFFSGISIYRFIGRKSKSEKLRQVNQRLLRTLSFQALCSLLFIYMPALICASAFIFRKDISQVSLYLSSAMSCGTLFNPIVEFILMSEYRQRIMFFCCRQKKASRISVVAHSVVSPKGSLVSNKEL